MLDSLPYKENQTSHYNVNFSEGRTSTSFIQLVMGLASASWKHCFPHLPQIKKSKEGLKPRAHYLQYIESQVSTSWGQENGSVDVYIYIQWNPGNVPISLLFNWWFQLRGTGQTPWYLWKKTTGNGGTSASSLNMCIFHWKVIKHCLNRELFFFSDMEELKLWVREEN